MPNFKAAVQLAALAFALAVVTLPGARQPAQAALGSATGNSLDATAQAAATGLVTAISAGDQHTCALKGGSVWCWGWNGYGQLGIDSTADSHVPARVSDSAGFTNSGVSAISAAWNDTCALKDGAAWCWGRNAWGQLGNNSTVQSLIPVRVSDSEGFTNTGVSAISGGEGHTCALKDGGAWCWGTGLYGQLGNNGTADSHVPVAVSGLASGVSAISAGRGHTCAVKDGGAWCWGAAYTGLLGNGTTTVSYVPVRVSDSAGFTNSGVSAISAGWEFTCALNNGGARCWGMSGAGQLGDGGATHHCNPYYSFECSSVPVAVTGLASGVSAVNVGLYHACALKEGTASCWGAGELGNNTTISPVPVMVSDNAGFTNSGVSAMGARRSHTCALKDDRAWCWGWNAYGQLGIDSTTDSPLPVAVVWPWKLPYAPNAGVRWTGGPHALRAGGDLTASFPASCAGLLTDAPCAGSGIDFSGGSFDVLAIADGAVEAAHCDSEWLGCIVAVRHASGVVSVYAHLATTEPGGSAVSHQCASGTTAQVCQGEKIAVAGSTGRGACDVPAGATVGLCTHRVLHLHFELRQGTGPDGTQPTCSGSHSYTVGSFHSDCFGDALDWDGIVIDGWQIHEYFSDANRTTAYNYDGSATKRSISVDSGFRYTDHTYGLRTVVATVDSSFTCPVNPLLSCEPYPQSAASLTQFAGGGTLGAGGGAGSPVVSPSLDGVGQSSGELTSTNVPVAPVAVGGLAEQPDAAALPAQTSTASADNRMPKAVGGAVAAALAIVAAGGWAMRRRRRE